MFWGELFEYFVINTQRFKDFKLKHQIYYLSPSFALWDYIITNNRHDFNKCVIFGRRENLTFFVQFYFLKIWFSPSVDIIGIKPAPGDHESNFNKVDAIPCGCNTK